MRIAVHDYAGFQFPLELSRELSNRDHQVFHLFTQASGGPKASFSDIPSANLQVVNIHATRIEKDNFLNRWVQERRYGQLAIDQLNRWRPDVVISANTPLMAQRQIIRWAGRQRVPSIFWLQDLLSVAAGTILSTYNRLLGRLAYAYLKRLEIEALATASHVVSINDDFLPDLYRWKINPDKITVIPNWGPIEQIPVLPRRNPFSDRYELSDRFVVLYSGTLGRKQDIRLIAEVAAKMADQDDTLFVVATDERGHKLLNRQLPEKAIPNLRQLPLQPSHLYPYLLASSDVCLVTLQPSASRYCVPSKLWSIYCARKPSIVAVDPHNPAARITQRIRAGMVVHPGSVDACMEAVTAIKNDPSLGGCMARNARTYAEEHFPIASIADSFERIVQQVSTDGAQQAAI